MTPKYLVSEPVRVYVYTLLSAVLGALVVYGVVDANAVPVIMAVVTAALAVPAVELVRSKVSPVRE